MADNLVAVITEVLNVQNRAMDEIHRYLQGTHGYDEMIMPPDFFKLGTICQVDKEGMEIHTSSWRIHQLPILVMV